MLGGLDAAALRGIGTPEAEVTLRDVRRKEDQGVRVGRGEENARRHSR